MKRVKLIFLLFFTTFSMIATAQANKSYHGDGIDDYLRFVPFTSVFALKAIGVESTHSWKQLTLRAAASGAMTAGITFTLKQIIHKNAPTVPIARPFHPVIRASHLPEPQFYVKNMVA